MSLYVSVYYNDGTKKTSIFQAQSVYARLFCVVLYNKAVALTSHFTCVYSFSFFMPLPLTLQILRIEITEYIET